MKRSSKAVLLTSLYLAQGLPYGFFTQAVPVLLRKAELSLPIIGLANLLTLPWALKFLWAPAMDRFEFRGFGLRRSWLIPLQIACIVLYGTLASLSFTENLSLVFIAFLITNLLSASQDIATDGLAVDILDQSERGWANGIQVAAYRIGMIVGGGALLAVYDQIGWNGSMLAMAAITLMCTWPVWAYREPPRTQKPPTIGLNVKRGLREALHFFSKPGAWHWAVVLLLYKFGHASATSMLRPWLVDRGYGLTDIGWILGTGGFVAGFLGAVVGGWFSSRFANQRMKLLVIFSAVQLLAVSSYLWPLLTEHSVFKVLVSASLDHFSSGLATVTLFACMMDACSKERAASDYTVQACLVVISQTTAALSAGFLADAFGYSIQFLCASAMGILAFMAAFTAYRKLSPTLFKSVAQAAAIVAVIAASLSVSSTAYAQGAEQNEERYAFGIHGGPLLPRRMGKVREVMQGWGLRGTLPTSRGTFEVDSFFSRDEGTSYNSFALDYKFSVFADEIPAHFILGVHGDWYTPPELGSRFAGGWHFGGGFSQPISESVSLRGDFKYRIGPGQSLYVGIGVEVQFGNDAGS
ncbi:MAG TPA: MFS transporter [Bdellovibrionales bacterium]|nr:MFS transporter [Bdellovibrionales bacterium]